jgi:hypothetical protein
MKGRWFALVPMFAALRESAVGPKRRNSMSARMSKEADGSTESVVIDALLPFEKAQ